MTERRKPGIEANSEKSANKSEEAGNVVAHKYTEEEKAFFHEYVQGHRYEEIQAEFIKRFGWEISKVQISGSIQRYGLNTGFNGEFKKGYIPYNKGKKMSPELYEKCQVGMFKPGNTPPNWRPVGSRRISKDGYIEVKTAEPRTWELLHRKVWKDHFGEIQKGCIIIFCDGDKTNCDISNLRMVERSVSAVMNHSGIKASDPETMDAAIKLAKLISATSKRRKNRNDQ